MRPALAILATCLACAVNAAWAMAPPTQGSSPSTVMPQAKRRDPGKGPHAAEVRHLQRAVSAQEAKRQAAQRRLREQDRVIRSLRRQLQSTTGHDSVQAY